MFESCKLRKSIFKIVSEWKKHDFPVIKFHYKLNLLVIEIIDEFGIAFIYLALSFKFITIKEHVDIKDADRPISAKNLEEWKNWSLSHGFWTKK